MAISFEITPPINKSSYHLIDMIATVVCKRGDIDRRVLTLRIKKKRIADLRHLYAHFCYLYTNVTLDEIGKTINRSAPTVRDSYILIRDRVNRQDRTIYSLYLKVKWDIDDYIKCIHPATYKDRCARIQRVERIDLKM